MKAESTLNILHRKRELLCQVAPRRGRHAAAQFFHKLLKRSGRVPDRLVTDRLRSYRAAHGVGA